MCDICKKEHLRASVTENDLNEFVEGFIGTKYKNSNIFEKGIDFDRVIHWRRDGKDEKLTYVYMDCKGKFVAWYLVADGIGNKQRAK